MKIQLNHIQRLNLYALAGAQRGDVATVRALWALQDKLALTPSEEAAIELKREIVAGQETVAWNPLRSTPTKEFELKQSEIARIRAIFETWTHYKAAGDRAWLEPLLTALMPQEPRE